MSKGIYVGKLTSVPIYDTEVTSVPFSLENFESFFHLSSTTGSYTTSGNAVQIKPTRGTLNVTLTALYDLTNVHIAYYYRSTSYPVTISINGVSQTLRPATSSQALSTMNLMQGDTIAVTLKYSSASASCPYINIHCDDLYIENTTITGYEEKEVARKVNKFYAGIESDVPIYEGSLVSLNAENVSNFFNVYNGVTVGWHFVDTEQNTGLKLSPDFLSNNSDNQVSIIFLTALKDLTNVSIGGTYSVSYLGTVAVGVGDTEVLNRVLSSSTNEPYSVLWTGNLSAGDSIYLSYIDISASIDTCYSSTYFTITCDDISVKTVVGYETKEAARKIIKGYIGVNGVAKPFFETKEILGFNYTGDYTISSIEKDGLTHTLYTLTSSGTLNLSEEVSYWACAGGGGGGRASLSNSSSGGGGGGGYTSEGKLQSGTHNIIIGAGGLEDTAGGDTSIGSMTIFSGTAGSNRGAGGDGASGGGCGYNGTSYGGGGEGSGESTCPFGITSLLPHSAGGAGGLHGANYGFVNGGSNGSDAPNVNFREGKGGVYGGGDGGHSVDSTLGLSPASEDMHAFFYGGGGGGGCYSSSSRYQKGGNGYQGVVYLLI